MSSWTVHLLLWRLSVAVAAAIIALSVCLGYEVIQQIRFFSGAIQAFGGKGEIHWDNVSLFLGLITSVGIVLPIAYIRWIWHRAFRSGR